MNAKKFLAVIICLIASKTFAADNAIRVTQPAYHYMSFYVYKPANLPIDIYATFDGYLVYKNKDIWYYASYNNGSVTKTGYVVGSVIPQVVKLKPYNARVSSVAPILGTQAAEPEAPRIIEVDSSSPVYSPDWTRDSNFMSISKWRGSVDRVGVLSRPKVPVAWKGDYPNVIYVWTGAKWKQIFPRSNFSSALSTLRREIYSLTVETNKANLLHWQDMDSHVLAQYTNSWGYEWLGVINLGSDYR